MKTGYCSSPIDWPTLIEYWLGELEEDAEAQVEEHYLGCDYCSRRLAELNTLGQGVRAVARASGVNAIVNEPFVHRLAEHGLQVREYHVPQNGSVNCTIAPDDDFVVAYLEAPLTGVTRLDLVDIHGDTEQRHTDIPFIAGSGGVLVSTRAETLRGLTTTTLRMRLVAVDDHGDRPVGEYTFHHTPSG